MPTCLYQTPALAECLLKSENQTLDDDVDGPSGTKIQALTAPTITRCLVISFTMAHHKIPVLQSVRLQKSRAYAPGHSHHLVLAVGTRPVIAFAPLHASDSFLLGHIERISSTSADVLPRRTAPLRARWLQHRAYLTAPPSCCPPWYTRDR